MSTKSGASRGWAIALVGVIGACVAAASGQAPKSAVSHPSERHLRNVKQLTFGGENAEAYFSFDGRKLSFQSTGKFPCDQIFTMNADGSGLKLVSTGKGRTT